MSGPADGWPSRVEAWAQARPDVHALVQIGSRVQPGSVPDDYSDYDYQIITSRPGRFQDGSFARELGPCWAYGAQASFGNVIKVTAVYEGALEADFVLLRRLDMLVATLALRFPSTAPLWPGILSSGVANLRIVAAPGWRVIKGGAAWERRYKRITPLRRPLGQEDFTRLCGEFWSQLVWAAKKARRGELIACQRAYHAHLLENALRLFQEEALLGGRRAFPLGRRAEAWLTQGEAAALEAGTRPEAAALLDSLSRLAEEFSRSSAAVAAINGWPGADYAEVRGWLAAGARV